MATEKYRGRYRVPTSEILVIRSESFRFIVYDHGNLKRVLCYNTESNDHHYGCIYLDATRFSQGVIQVEKITKAIADLPAAMLFLMQKDLLTYYPQAQKLHGKHAQDQLA